MFRRTAMALVLIGLVGFSAPAMGAAGRASAQTRVWGGACCQASRIRDIKAPFERRSIRPPRQRSAEPPQAMFSALRGVAGKMSLIPDWQVCVFWSRRTLLLEQANLRGEPEFWFRPSRASHFLLLAPRESNQREGHPDIRPRLRRDSLLPSPLQGHAAKGHPWPIKWGRRRYLAASMRLVPPYATPTLGLLTGPGRELARFPRDQVRRRLFLLLLLSCDRIDDTRIPFRRPSGIAA